MRRTLSLVIAASLAIAVCGADAATARGAAPARLAAPDSSGAYPLEVMLLLDRSGSLDGTPLTNLKNAASSFAGYFAGTQDTDRMGLVTFATAVTVDHPLGTDFVAPVQNAIAALTSIGATDMEDALAQAGGPLGFTDQSGLPGPQRARQAVVFFSDGMPTAIRGTYLNHGSTYDAVGCVTGNCQGTGNNADGNVYDNLGSPSIENSWIGGVHPAITGDGTTLANCGSGSQYTTRWYAFDANPVPGYAPTAQCIPDNPLHDHICSMAADLTLHYAQVLKDRGVTIFTIGLGPNVNAALMQQIASVPSDYYYAPTSSQLQQVFQAIAQALVPPATQAIRESFGGLKLRYLK